MSRGFSEAHCWELTDALPENSPSRGPGAKPVRLMGSEMKGGTGVSEGTETTFLTTGKRKQVRDR